MTLFFLLVALPIIAQWKNVATEFGSMSRQYRIYVPSGYQPEKPAALVFAFHGLSGTMTEFSRIIEIDDLAEKENIIVVCPQGVNTRLFGGAWNAGATFTTIDIGLNKGIDDVGFIRFLIDKIADEYTVNLKNVFAFGFSLGGFMTQRLALELNDKIHAFASVAGTIGNGLLPIPPDIPGQTVSIAHFHGVEDHIVGYEDNAFGLNVDNLIEFWRVNNNGKLEPEHTFFPDIKKDDITVDRYTYTSDFNSSKVVLYRVNNGKHNWLKRGVNDISYTDEIWKFFKQNSTLSKDSFEIAKTDMIIYPNPLRGNSIYVRFKEQGEFENDKCNIVVYDCSGRKVTDQECNLFSGNGTITVPDFLEKGLYWVKVTGNKKQFIASEKLLIN